MDKDKFMGTILVHSFMLGAMFSIGVVSAIIQSYDPEALASAPDETVSQSSVVTVEVEKQPLHKYCVTLRADQGWQVFTFPESYGHITLVKGYWSVDPQKYRAKGPRGLHRKEFLAALGDDEIREIKGELSEEEIRWLLDGPMDQDLERHFALQKEDGTYPLGALLVEDKGKGVRWIKGAKCLSKDHGSIRMRINEQDHALGNNQGELKICFGTESANPHH